MADNSNIELPETLLNAVLSKSPSQGFTHTFYKYPARFSPEFARTAIQTFTKPGDVVLDPFMGSGTTLIEALVSGRHAIGSDISRLASFIARVKTTILTSDDRDVIEKWVQEIQLRLPLTQSSMHPNQWVKEGYQKDIPRPLRKTIEYILCELDTLPRQEQRKLVRCAILRTGQWAIDCTSTFPSAAEFRIKFAETLQEYFRGLSEVQEIIEANFNGQPPKIICLAIPALELNPALWETQICQKPSLVVTSPPYPSVHVLYHRWQIKGRKESAAPFWIVDELDGHGASYYTMGSRTPTGLNNYFKSIQDSFIQIHKLLAEDAVVPPWDWTAGKVKTSVYTIGKKGVQNGTTTEIYSGVQSACCP